MIYLNRFSCLKLFSNDSLTLKRWIPIAPRKLPAQVSQGTQTAILMIPRKVLLLRTRAAVPLRQALAQVSQDMHVPILMIRREVQFPLSETRYLTVCLTSQKRNRRQAQTKY